MSELRRKQRKKTINKVEQKRRENEKRYNTGGNMNKSDKYK